MALTRKKLVALGIESDKIDEIIEAHVETVNALKSELDENKGNAEALAKVTKERDRFKAELDELKESVDANETYKDKYDALKDEYDEYKKGVQAENTKASKLKAYKALLEEVGISNKRIDAVIKVSDLSKIELDKDGAIKNADSVKEQVRTDWDDFIVTGRTEGADTKKPPKNDGHGGAMTKDDILAIKDTAARQQAIAENHELFGI